MREAVLITGGTGFLGTEIIAGLVRAFDIRIYALVRAENEAAAVHRLKEAWYRMKDIYGRIGTQILPVCGDFTREDLGLCKSDGQMLRDNVTLVIHSGAEIGFQKDEKELWDVNCGGTKNMLRFARKIKQLRRFVHISTAYVAGQKEGLVMEEGETGTSFSSLYEKSKAAAEKLVRKAGVPFSICRPGMIVGHSETGRVKSFNTIYYVLKLLLLGELPVIPVKPDTHLNLVPVDYVADGVAKISFAAEAEGKTFHLTCPTSLQPRAEELANYVRDWARSSLGIQLPKPACMPLGVLKKAGLTYNEKKAGKKKGFVTNLLMLLPYFFGNQDFDRTNTDRIVGKYTLDWHDYIDALLDFACRRNFMRQTGQTVFEQAKVRRESTRYPIRYFDITPEGIRKTSGAEANEKIGRITAALYARGVRKGDRIALTGVNSVDYMTLDHAIGLIGAVSVPIYYTAPAEEVSLLLSRSGAKMFFIGDGRMMEKIGKIETEAEMVAFATALANECAGVLRWDDFLAAAEGAGPAVPQYPDPDDPATIRYTSGTTGDPKGVIFQFAQLSWMGEVLTNLLPWKERNRSMRYLSFLPQSHVVEGILAAYAPYYMLAGIDYYYLQDFGGLAEALPRVRPTVFFSVPRFYEKIWTRFSGSRAGKAWLAMKEGPAKKAAGAALGRMVLRKSGLDACRQLIVGSAPMGRELLQNFRRLGIEIYNAYGQTEAPLITINRLGDNVPGTVGTPLPETEVTLAPDGELLVKGPQVSPGYYHLESDTMKDGILRTGDLGRIRRDGHVIIGGRKKEMIITAYGKNISIPKIEERLKAIPGVTEAVLIGENRPYCTALLWMEHGAPDPGVEIAMLNTGLSSPEQIRRYKVVDLPLSIDHGELTPNLKVKRARVAEHFAYEIEEMYR